MHHMLLLLIICENNLFHEAGKNMVQKLAQALTNVQKRLIMAHFTLWEMPANFMAMQKLEYLSFWMDDLTLSCVKQQAEAIVESMEKLIWKHLTRMQKASGKYAPYAFIADYL